MNRVKRIIKNLIAFANDVTEHNSAAYAGSVSFFFFFSMIPTLMFLFTLVPYLPITKDDLIYNIERVVPSNITITLVNAVNDIYAASKGVMPIVGIAAIWTASVGIFGLIRGLNGILEIKDKRNYFIMRGIALLYTLLLMAAILIIIIVSVFGKSLINHIIGFYPDIEGILKLCYYLKWPVVLLFLFILFVFAYAFLPGERQRMIYQLPGALFSALGWLVVTGAFSIYIDYFHGFSTYGSLMGLMIILFWFYLCFSILIIGAYLNKYYKAQFSIGYEKVRKKRKDRKEAKKTHP